MERWSRDQVLALAPDAPARRAAPGVAQPRAWTDPGCHDPGDGGLTMWGLCKGSGSTPYQCRVDLSGPAYRCSCPSRKFPCKHALGLLLLWSDGHVPETGALPAWVGEWLEQRRERATTAAARPGGGPSRRKDAPAYRPSAFRIGTSESATGRPAAQRRRAEQRERRVAGGLDDLDRWLADQVRHGLAGTQHAGYGHWEQPAKRLVDAQAPAVAGALRRLAAVPASGDGWPGRLLAEYALLRLLVVAHRRLDELPGALRHTVRARVGYTVTRDEVLAGPRIRDRWDVLGQRDTEEDRLKTRRVWLRGRACARTALVLSFAAAPGQRLDASLVPGTTADAELAFYPGAPALRALVAHHHGTAAGGVPPGEHVTALLERYAAALAQDPWLDAWPSVLTEVTPARGSRWSLTDPAGESLPLHPAAGDPWTLVAVSGGHPVTVAGEWTPQGFLPLTAWDAGGRVAVL